MQKTSMQTEQSGKHPLTDLALVRRYEPVIHYTEGELFFPCAVDSYLRHCSLWMADVDRRRTRVAGPGELTEETLAQHSDIPSGKRLYLQFVAEPLDALHVARWRRRPARPHFRNANRLERVGLSSRIIDGLFEATLLARGRVPGGTVAVAEAQYHAFAGDASGRVYYARVLRQAGYIILHYIFFYVMNDWRSSFHGVNDHESDWEQIFVYLSEEESGEPIPRWVAYASHDFKGDDLRRRWDDIEIKKVDNSHPVVFAGAGSHASYFSSGEYLTQVMPAFLTPVRKGALLLDRFWNRTLQQADTLGLEDALTALTSIPFVDYARGDGRRIGPGQPEPWTPILISDKDGWVDAYRGLWGLDTWDPLGGERAPGGPKYERNGTIRQSWSDPLGWAGLDKVPPPNQMADSLQRLLSELKEEMSVVKESRDRQRDAVRNLELQVDVLRQNAYLQGLAERRRADLHSEEEVLRGLNERFGEIEETLEAAAGYLARLRAGDFGSPRAHIRHAHTPHPPLPEGTRLVRLWAAVSGGLLLVVVVLNVLFRPPGWPLWLTGALLLFGGLDALMQHQFLTYALRITILLAIITTLILLSKFWWLLLVLGMAALVLMMIRDNLRELSA